MLALFLRFDNREEPVQFGDFEDAPNSGRQPEKGECSPTDVHVPKRIDQCSDTRRVDMGNFSHVDHQTPRPLLDDLQQALVQRGGQIERDFTGQVNHDARLRRPHFLYYAIHWPARASACSAFVSITPTPLLDSGYIG